MSNQSDDLAAALERVLPCEHITSSMSVVGCTVKNYSYHAVHSRRCPAFYRSAVARFVQERERDARLKALEDAALTVLSVRAEPEKTNDTWFATRTRAAKAIRALT